MPILWAIDHPRRLVEATARDILRRPDIEAFLDGIAIAATLSYRKLFDATQSTIELGEGDLTSISAWVHKSSSTTQMGAVAIVVGSDEMYEHALAFEALTAARRPLKVFRQLRDAQKWLDENRGVAPRHQDLDSGSEI